MRHDLTDALDALLPTRPSGRFDCNPGETCAKVVVQDTPAERDAVVDLTRGGSVTITWGQDVTGKITAMTNAAGDKVALPDSNDFSTGQVYLYEGNAKAEARMVNYMRSIGFKMQVNADGTPFECRLVGVETDCRNIRVESRSFADLMH